MFIHSLRIRDLRCLQAVDIEPSAGLNLLVGDNGSGKTSLLEAVNLLSRGRSFRSTPQTRLIRQGADSLSIFARAKDDDSRDFTVGITRDSEALRLKLSHDPDARLLQLVRAVPVQLLDPGLHALFEEGPSERRRYLDWGVFHVEHAFYPAWQRYRRALQQRNSALRARVQDSQVRAWDRDLVTAAGHIDATRQRYVSALNEILPGFLQRFPNTESIEIEYVPGWPRDMRYAEALDAGMERDRQLGYTMHGPHRADLRIRWHGVRAEHRASRGEQKILICSLILAQAALMAEQTGRRPILLIDDLAAELGESYRGELLAAVRELKLQSFLTCLDSSLVRCEQGDERFHVEHGRIARMV